MKAFVFVFTFLFILVSCDRTYKKSQFGLSVTGKVGEVLVVCEKKIWESEVKNYLDTNITQFIMPYFPDVATFELVHRTPKVFEGGNKRWRNLMFIELDPKAKENKITQEKNTWATGQIIIRLIAKDYNGLISLCQNELKSVHSILDNHEWKRMLTRLKNENNTYNSKKIKENFGISLALPRNSKIITKRPNFYRIDFPTDTKPMEFIGGNGQKANFIQSGIFIYQYDFQDSSQFAFDKLIQARDTMLKYNVPHEVKGAYMGTQYAKVVFPEFNVIKNEKNTLTGTEIRGMYKFLGRGDFTTGGCFWEYHFLNKRNKIICVSGYLDAPPTLSWIMPLREIQAVLKSAELE